MRTRKTMQRVICLLFIVAMMCTELPVSAFGETTQETKEQEILTTPVAEPETVPQDTLQEPQETPPNTEAETVPDLATQPDPEPIKQGWVTNEDGTQSYYDVNGVKVTGWQQQDGQWYYLKPETGIMASSETVDIGGKKYYFEASGRMITGWAVEQDVWYYARSDGSLYLGWQLYKSQWYYLDQTSGVMCVNQWVDDHRYYMDGNGHISTGWVLDKATGEWYYMKASGLAAPGWLQHKGQWYFIQSNGLMTTNGWVQSKGLWYYMNANGHMATGWVLADDTWYYLNSSGVMATGWLKLGNTWYYLKSSGAMVKGWATINGSWYYMRDSGAMATGWLQLGDTWYYLKSSGAMATGWLKSGNTWYYLKGSGAMATGWATVGGRWYYMRDSGAMVTGWAQVGSTYYYMNSSGAMLTGWQKISGVWYYLNGSGAMQTGWVDVNGTRYYLRESGAMLTGWQKISDLWYYFSNSGAMAKDTMIGNYYVNSEGVWKEPAAGETDLGTLIFKDVSPGGKTIKNLLQNAMKPVANTLYIWGGGWDSEIGGDARRIGTNPQWKAFYNTYAGHYDFDNYRYSYKNGLDCSGYVGWAIYNTINTQSNKNSVTVQSTTIANYLVKTKGWGEPDMLNDPTVFRPGDICSMDGHVYMVVGTCSDGSVVILHSSPQAGVQLSGSVVLSTGSQNSQAYALAKQYNEKYFPNWAYKTRCVGVGYFSEITRCRWKVSGTGSILTDPDNYLNLSADQVLANLFGE